ncbi:unnamed protein product, partial [Symbiodinium natans]
GNEDEGVWPANPWQAQADAHLLHLQRSLQEAAGPAFLFPCAQPCVSSGLILAAPAEASQQPRAQPTAHAAQPTTSFASPQAPSPGLLRRVHELEGQVASMEVAAAAQGRDLDEARAELAVLRRKPTSKVADDSALCALQEKIDFLQVLVNRFERKVMTLEEENAGLTVALGKQAPSRSTACQTEGVMCELEAQVELLEEKLHSKEVELQQAQESLEAERAQRSRDAAAVCGRTPRQLADEVDSLQSRTSFLSDLVDRFEDKTMALEKQLKEMREKLSCSAAKQELAEEAMRQSANALQESREEAESSKLLLRDTKKEHNKKVQELLKQIQLARCRRTDAKSQEELQRLRDELQELKELNSRLVERLGHERAEHADARQQLHFSERERQLLELRTEHLSEQEMTSI